MKIGEYIIDITALQYDLRDWYGKIIETDGEYVRVHYIPNNTIVWRSIYDLKIDKTKILENYEKPK